MAGDTDMYGRTHRIHLIGIGGSGMCGIAEVLLNMGYQISGSDLKASETTDRLVALGGRVFIGHAASNVEGAQVVVYSTAVRDTNEELCAAQAAGIPVIGRAEMLAELMRMKYGIAVGGSHGKTTTTSLIAALLARGGLDPTVVVGGRLRAYGSNARLGHGRFMVAEADESDGSFLRLAPAVTVITNVDREHLDHYGDFAGLRQAFVYFANRVPFYGVSILCMDDPLTRDLLPDVTKRTVTYGFAADADVRASDLAMDAEGASFVAHAFGQRLGEVRLRLHGRHNVQNALAALAVGRELEVGFAHMAEALAAFTGVTRRMDLRGEVAHVRVIDDYAHHPTEIRATLAAARGAGGGQLLAIFQPHRYTRTAALAREFGEAFGDADRVWVLDVYAAGETPIAGVSGRTISDSAEAAGVRHVTYAPDAAAAVRAAIEEARAGDQILLLGAGDVTKLANDLLEGLRRHDAVAGERG
jgi:UDP-N-acetylmuramate--alanine ligase